MSVVYLRDLEPLDQLIWILSWGIWNDNSIWKDDAIWED